MISRSTLLGAVVCGAMMGLSFGVSALAQGAPHAAAPTPSGPTPSGPGSLSGLWILSGYRGSGGPSQRDRVLHTVDGKLPPLQPAAAAVLERRVQDAENGDPFVNTLTQCLPGGMPEMLFGAPYPVQILETASQVTMLFEEQNHFRQIRLNGKHATDPDPTFMGDSIGHWEGGILVVDTIGLTERTTLDQIGMPHSEDLHLIERYRRLDASTLQITVTIDDPRTFTQPWDARAVYKIAPPGRLMAEYVCENNRNAPDAAGHTGFDTQGSAAH